MTVPILTVSQLEGAHDIEKPRPIPLDKLLYATDLSPGTDRGMETALMLAQEFSAELIVLHVVRWLGGEYPFELLPPGLDQHAARSRHAVLERLVASVPESARREPWVRIELLGGAPSERILRFADDQNVDMIVLNIRSPSGLDRALLGSTAKRVVRGAHVPVLSVPPGSGARTQLTRLSPTHLQDMGPRARNETHTSRS